MRAGTNCIVCLQPEISVKREMWIRKAFKKLDSAGTGNVAMHSFLPFLKTWNFDEENPIDLLNRTLGIAPYELERTDDITLNQFMRHHFADYMRDGVATFKVSLRVIREGEEGERKRERDERGNVLCWELDLRGADWYAY